MSAYPTPPEELADLIPLTGYPARRYRDTSTGAYRLAVWRFGRFDVLGQNPNDVPGLRYPSFTELLPIAPFGLRAMIASGSLVIDNPQ